MQFCKLGLLLSLLGISAVIAAEATKPTDKVSLATTAKANLQLIMLTKVNPQGLALWDITNAATGDDGEISAKLMKSTDWEKLLEHGKSLEEGGKLLASSNGIIAALPGAKLQDEGNAGAATAADVQRFVNAEPAEFRKHALALQKTGATVVAAAKQHDVKKLSEVANNLDAVCEGCHVKFWYPQQKR